MTGERTLRVAVFGLIAALFTVCMAAGQGKDAAKADAAKEELKKLEGTWRLEGVERGGEKVAVKDFKAKGFKHPVEVFGFNASTTFKGGRFSMTFGEETKRYALTVAPAKTPKWLDRVATSEGNSKGQT